MSFIIDHVEVYAALVSTGALFWLIWKEKPKIKIDILDLNRRDNEKLELLVSVINKTHYPIKLEAYGIEYIEDKHKRSMSILVFDKDEERNIRERDNRTLRLGMELFKKSRGIKLRYFFVMDSTYRPYRKRIPNRISGLFSTI